MPEPIPAVRVGYSGPEDDVPILQPGEYYLDTPRDTGGGMLHAYTPDKTRFAVLPVIANKKAFSFDKLTNKLTIKEAPEWAWLSQVSSDCKTKSGAEPNLWTIANGVWIKKANLP